MFCSYCERARGLFARKGVGFREIKVDEDPAQRAIMLQRAHGRRTVPQIFIGDLHVGGYADLYELDRKGALDQLLNGSSS